ncbi:MAG: aldehyde dehydrogenase family protein, partial [Phyllobacterium sp.]
MPDTATIKEAEPIKALIGGAWRDAEISEEVRDPYTGNVVALVPKSSSEDCNAALAAATRAKKIMAATPGYERASLLRRAADIVTARAEEIARAM